MAKFEAGQVVHHRLSGEKLIVAEYRRRSGGRPDRIVCQWRAHDAWREHAFNPDELLSDDRHPEPFSASGDARPS